MGSRLVADVSLAILELAEEDKLARIESKWFTHPGACVSVSGSNSGADARLGLWRFRGLFLINAVVSCLMLLIHLAMFVSQKGERDDQLRTDIAEGGKLRWLRAWLRRFDAFEGRQGEPVRDGHGAAELNRLQGLADGGADQQGAMGDSQSTDANSGGNTASAPVSDEILAPVVDRPIEESVQEPTRPSRP
jgi:hypothetical protein